MLSMLCWQLRCCLPRLALPACNPARHATPTYPSQALVMADLIQTAVTILQRGQQLYPFQGLQDFPQVGGGREGGSL